MAIVINVLPSNYVGHYEAPLLYLLLHRNVFLGTYANIYNSDELYELISKK